MKQDSFVVIDFIIRLGELPKNVEKVAFSPLAERATQRMRDRLTKSISNWQGRIKAEHLGEVDKVNKRTTQMGSIVIKSPTMKDVMRVEDILRRSKVDTGEPVVLRLLDKASGVYFKVEVSDFRLSGPNGGAWKPFTEWYKGTKQLGLPQ